MIKVMLSAVCCWLSIHMADAARILVVPHGSGNGSSWAQATNLQQALARAAHGDEIWVAKGSYTPTATTTTEAHFRIPDGVRLLGGFNGTETSKDQRDWHRHATVLSGDIGTIGYESDNSATVVYFEHASAATVLDGFIVSGGHAKAFKRGGDPAAAGAAIFNNGANGVSSPTIRNCILRDNLAREGAALYNYCENGRCEPHILNCHFIRNQADFNGGAVYNNGDGGVCKPRFESCSFQDNAAVYGGGILNSGRDGECLPDFKSSTFVGNRCGMGGAALYNKRTAGARVYAFMTDCRVGQNYSTVGSDIENNGRLAAKAAGVDLTRIGL